MVGLEIILSFTFSIYFKFSMILSLSNERKIYFARFRVLDYKVHHILRITIDCKTSLII